MSTTPVPVNADAPSLVDKILSFIDTILSMGQGLIPFDAYALLLERLIQKGVAAYEAHTGQPIDPTLIKPIDPVV